MRTVIRRIAAAIRDWLFGTLPQPGKLGIDVKREIQMALEFLVTIDRSGPQSADVEYGVMTVDTVLQGQPRRVRQQLPKDALSGGPFYGSDNTELTAQYYEVDDAGNEGPASTFTATLADTIAPNQPGPLAVSVTAEIPDDQVPPAE